MGVKNIEMLPDENEMSVLIDLLQATCNLNFEPSVIGNYYRCSTYSMF